MTFFICKFWEHYKNLHVDTEIVSRSGREINYKIIQLIGVLCRSAVTFPL